MVKQQQYVEKHERETVTAGLICESKCLVIKLNFKAHLLTNVVHLAYRVDAVLQLAGKFLALYGPVMKLTLEVVQNAGHIGGLRRGSAGSAPAST